MYRSNRPFFSPVTLALAGIDSSGNTTDKDFGDLVADALDAKLGKPTKISGGSGPGSVRPAAAAPLQVAPPAQDMREARANAQITQALATRQAGGKDLGDRVADALDVKLGRGKPTMATLKNARTKAVQAPDLGDQIADRLGARKAVAS